MRKKIKRKISNFIYFIKQKKNNKKNIYITKVIVKFNGNQNERSNETWKVHYFYYDPTLPKRFVNFRF